ncbi:MAG TPA: MarR family transcriptional regulator [Edaphobacter sp.]
MKKNSTLEAGDLIHAVGLITRRVRSESGTQDLALSEAAALKRLEIDGPMTTADLARAEGMKPQSMGAVVASLEEDGFVERQPHPTDGRQMLLRLTTKGAALRRSRNAAKSNWLTQAISRLDKDEQATLLQAAEILKRMAEQ